jgi:hypothetical protein
MAGVPDPGCGDPVDDAGAGGGHVWCR